MLKIKKIFSRISDFTEYLLVLTVILECNSMYVHTLTDSGVSMTNLFINICIALLLFLASVRIIFAFAERRVSGGDALRLFAVPACVLAYAFLVYFLNVLALNPGGASSYIPRFLVLLPLFVLFFRLEREEGRVFDLIYKYSDIVCLFCMINLVAYAASIIRPDSIPADLLYTRWSGVINSRVNYLNICTILPGMQWQITGILLPRNYGIFTEPLTFSIALITSLFTELFLYPSDMSENHKKKCLLRSILLSVVIITSQAVLGIILMLIAWAIKIIPDLVKEKKGRLIIPVAAFLIFVAIFAVAQKQGQASGAASTGDHIDDILIGIEAFLKKPFAGGGYGNVDYFRSFMSPERLAANSGFSNTAFMILAQGGVLFGFFCWFPYIIFILQLCSRNRKNRRAGLWGIGVMGVFVVIVFIYRCYMIMLLGLGYSLLDVQKGKKAAYRISLFPEQTLIKPHSPKAGTPGTGSAVIAAVLILFGSPIWSGLYRLLKTHQMLISQSPLNAYCLCVVILINIYILRRKRYILFTLCYDFFWIFLYARAYSLTSTLISLREGTYTDIWALHLLYFYVGGWILLLLLIKAAQKWKRPVALSACTAMVLVLSLTAIHATFTIEQSADVIEDQTAAVRLVSDSASGKIYSNDLPYLYHMSDKISLCAARNEGFCLFKNISVICSRGTVLRALFDNGFKVTKLDKNLVVYSNDQKLIKRLSAKGYTFYQYYPYRRNENLRQAAAICDNDIVSEGIILDESNPLNMGPYDTLDNGQYTMEYSLHIDNTDLKDSTIVAKLQITDNYGASALGSKKITAGQFDENGDAVIEVPFTVSTITEGIEYKVFPTEDSVLYCDRISLKETPSYVTLHTYNSHMKEIRSEFYDTDGTPYTFAGGYSAVNRTYNVGDQLKSVSYELNGKPVITSSGYFCVKYNYNIRGQVSRERYFDAEGKPLTLRSGYAAVKREYNRAGFDISDRYLDIHGDPAVTTAGYAEVHHKYNRQGQLIFEEYCDADGNRVMLADGYSAFEREFDENGYITDQTYLDISDQPCTISGGYVSVHWTYNDSGQAVREEYCDEDGDPVSSVNGYAVLERNYDAAGNVTDERYYDKSGKKTSLEWGVAEIKRTYNEKNQNIREEYYDTDGDKTACTAGYYGLKRKYDAAGNVSELIYTDRDGDPVTGSNGIAIIRYKYDKKRNCTDEYYYDPDGNPAECTGGYAEVHRTYDGYDVKSETYLNTEGETING